MAHFEDEKSLEFREIWERDGELFSLNFMDTLYTIQRAPHFIQSKD